MCISDTSPFNNIQYSDTGSFDFDQTIGIAGGTWIYHATSQPIQESPPADDDDDPTATAVASNDPSSNGGSSAT